MATKPKTVAVTIEIPAKRIQEILDSAKIGYWADFAEMRGRVLTVRESDPHDGKGTPEKKRIAPKDWARGLAVLAAESPSNFKMILDDNTDGYTGDALVQCCIFGKLVYG